MFLGEQCIDVVGSTKDTNVISVNGAPHKIEEELAAIPNSIELRVKSYRGGILIMIGSEILPLSCTNRAAQLATFCILRI